VGLSAQEKQIVLKLQAYFDWARNYIRIVGFNPWQFLYRQRHTNHKTLASMKLKETGWWLLAAGCWVLLFLFLLMANVGSVDGWVCMCIFV
jgi:hypothetical protein